jgi:hypothetical protein
MFLSQVDEILHLFLPFVFCLIWLCACNPITKTSIDLTILKRELPWGSSYNSIKNKLEDKLDLTFSKCEASKQSTSYIYLAGSFKRIETNSWKFIFHKDALEAIYIWMICKSVDQTTSAYEQLTKYFNSIADYEKGRDYDSWIYDEAYYAPPRLHDTNIILEKKGDSILIKFIHSANY